MHIIIKFYQTIYILSIDYWALMFTSDWASPGVRLRLQKLVRFRLVGKWAKFTFLETIMSHDTISWKNCHIGWVGCDNNRYTLSINFWALLFGSDWASQIYNHIFHFKINHIVTLSFLIIIIIIYNISNKNNINTNTYK